MKAPDINLRAIRAHEGRQDRAWEELAYQLRPNPGPGHIETRKTRAPDGGVEWYDVYDDGHEEGFQAKFNESLADALGGMDESVKAVTAKRPRMSRLTFVVPYDFTDSGLGRAKSDQDRWDDKVAAWKSTVEGADRVDFRTLRGGDIVETLSLAAHAGRRAYWFGNLELTSDWFERRWREAETVAGERYTPEADSPSRVNAMLDAAVLGPELRANLQHRTDLVQRRMRQHSDLWKSLEVDEFLDGLTEWQRTALGQDVGNGDQELPATDPDFGGLATLADELLTVVESRRSQIPAEKERALNAVVAAIESLNDLACGQLSRLCAERTMGVLGPAGEGKTHALLRCTRALLDRGAPAVAVLGQRLGDDNWWPAVSKVLGLVDTSSDNFLQALDSLAEARGCRAVLIVDALNESQRPSRWRAELPSLIAQVKSHRHIALIVSFRHDYRRIVCDEVRLPLVRHTGLAGHVPEAIERYCALFDVPVPIGRLADRLMTNPLFLRMYCEVLAHEPRASLDPPTRSDLFSRFAKVRMRRVQERLALSPTATEPWAALELVADLLLAAHGEAVDRAAAEEAVNALLPGRPWPDQLFQQLVSEGILELRPRRGGREDNGEVVGLPFQAFSEHLLGTRLLDTVGRDDLFKRLSVRLEGEPWLWRAMAVLLPERLRLELVDLLNETADEFRLKAAMRESFTDRDVGAFTERTSELLEGLLDFRDRETAETVFTLAPLVGHPANANWLHSHLTAVPMAERDATWSIATFSMRDWSESYLYFKARVEALPVAASVEEVKLLGIGFMWLLTSPNRFMRDEVSQTLACLMSQRLTVAVDLVEAACDVDDPYVQQRVLVAAYGAVMTGGDADLPGVESLCVALDAWLQRGLPVDVLARDSARGIVAWAHDRGVVGADWMGPFAPPYGAPPPAEPLAADELENLYGPVKDANGDYAEWRAASILMSCLTWMGDFNKYVVKGDVNDFSLYPLSGPPPEDSFQDPLREVSAEWAGRWIAQRAIGLGWTADRFEAFERSRDLHQGRDSHKAERFGKKYQWIAHHELLARLADNFHLARQPWDDGPATYEGPWPWYGRDFDPSLPPTVTIDGVRVCPLGRSEDRSYCLHAPDIDAAATPYEWVGMERDLPSAGAMFEPKDAMGGEWIALQRYSTWNRADPQRRGMSKRVRDVFFLQFAWLAPRGQGRLVFDVIKQKGLSGRWMPDGRRPYTQYFGELGWSPVEAASPRNWENPKELESSGLRAWPAIESWRWEGHVANCSFDETIDLYVPTTEFLGDAKWVPGAAAWTDPDSGRVVCQALQVADDENGQSVLVADRDWLAKRLESLDADLVIGTLSEKHSLPDEDDGDGDLAYSDIHYAGLMRVGEPFVTTGPIVNVRAQGDGRARHEVSGTGPNDVSPTGAIPDAPFDPTDL